RALPSLRVELRHGDSRTARGGHTVEGTVDDRSEENHTFGAPGAAARHRRIGERLGRAPGDFAPLPLPIREEPQRTAVRRPERKGGVLGPRYWLGGQRVERPDPQEILAIGVPRDADESRAVWRECDGSDRGLVRQGDGGSHRNGESPRALR